jgi:pilus assembly protein Flp/PilA
MLRSGDSKNSNQKRRIRTMRSYLKEILHFTKRDDGPTAVEYAVILSLIVVACVASVALVGLGASDIFSGAAPAAAVTPLSGPPTGDGP